MQRLQLYVEDTLGAMQLIDLFENESVQLTSTIQDVRDIGKVFTDYSQTFTVPASDTNNKVFRHFYNYFITGGAFDPRKKKRAEIHINYTPFKKGKIFLNSVQMKNNKAYAYVLIFYGNMVSLKDLMGDDELTDLSYLDNYNHEYTDSIVKSGFTDGLDFTVNSVVQQDAIIYPLITSKKRLFYHSGTIPFQDNTDGNLYYDGSSKLRGLAFTDLKPAIKTMHLIEAIEAKYNIEFTRDFFSLTNPAFSNLYFWINGVKDEFNNQEESDYEEFKFDCTGYTFDATSDDISEVTFANGIVEITKTGSAPAYFITVTTTPVDDDVRFTISFTEVDSNGDAISGGESYEVVKGEYIGGGTPQGIVAIPTGSANGTVKRFKIEYSANTRLDFDSTIEIQKATNGSLIDFTEKYDITNTELTFSINLRSDTLNIMPKMKVIDFLTGLFKMFNLTAYYIDDDGDARLTTSRVYNNSRPLIYVDTLDNFYSDAVNNKLGGMIDLDKYLDIKEHTVDAVLPFTDIKFQYQSNDTVLMENHLNQFNEVFGDAEFNVRKAFPGQLDRGEKYEIQLPFSHMKYERLIDLNSVSYTDTKDTSIQWGYCAQGEFNFTEGVSPSKPSKGDYESMTIAPLLFYAISEETGPTKKINWISSSSVVGIDTYWRPSNSNEDGNSTTPPSYTLNFDAEVDEWQGLNYSELPAPLNNLESQSLYYVFYRSYVEGVFNAAKRMFKVKAFLPPRILVHYRLNDQIKMQDKIFRINSITTNLMTGESELELLNIFSNEIVE